MSSSLCKIDMLFVIFYQFATQPNRKRQKIIQKSHQLLTEEVCHKKALHYLQEEKKYIKLFSLCWKED